MLEFIKNISPTEMIIIVLILVVLFGGRLIARLGRASGETVREIKKVKKEFSKALEDDEPGEVSK